MNFRVLEERLQRSERWVRLSMIGWGITVTLLVAAILTSTVHARQPQTDKLRVRELAIVDEMGRERIVIAAPLPNPVVNGRVEKRIRVVSAGVQFKAPDGTERGGIAASDDGSFMFGIDDERGHERAHLYYLPSRGSGVYLQDGNDKESVSLLLPAGGRDPKLVMVDEGGKQIAEMPPQK
ncbi:MAG: hypothetical protein JOZ48_09850 [Acidobacteriaceae bacterium]|nr:hypothetical protein [Acidobacteriaceae bacterium]